MNAPVSDSTLEHWKMHFDGSLNIDGTGVGVYFISPSRDRLSYVLRIHLRPLIMPPSMRRLYTAFASPSSSA
jgi:hypothetical protein